MLSPKLISELKNIVGEKWVLTEPGDLFVYSFDSALDRARPSAVVLPANSSELIHVVQLLSKYKQAFVARGAATSLCGGPIALNEAVVIGAARINRIGKLDPTRNEIYVGPGVVNLRLQEAVAPKKLFFAPDPGSQKACTIGGNVGTNAGGPHCLKYGVTSNHVAGLDLVLPDGQTLSVRTTDPGFDITGFFVGAEGTLGVVTGITLKLLPLPDFIRTMVVSFPSIEDAIQSVANIIAAGILPATLEAMDKTTVTAVEAFIHAGYPLEAEAVLLIEVDGDNESVLDLQIEQINKICSSNNSFNTMFAKDEAERKKLWEGRRGSYAAMARLAPNVLVEDGAVPRTKLPEALRAVKQIAEEAGLQVALLFHAGDGNLHPQIIFDERDVEKTRIVKEAGHKMLKACVDLGGTISGEHGIGIDKREAMKWLFSRETLSLFRRLKNEFDPQNLSNPNKLIPLISKNADVLAPDSSDKAPSNLLGLTTPANEEEMIVTVREWARGRKMFGIQGARTKFHVTENMTMNMTNLNKILDFDRGNLTVTVQAGALLSDVRAETEASNQYLWVAGEGTVGGVIATRVSAEPPLRDQILGMRILLPTGEVVKLGAKTMKNVAGYDVSKLLIGSWGTLAIILDVTFRLFPYPAKNLTAQPIQPFLYKDIHKKIKRAFDPFNILSLRTVMMTPRDIGVAIKEQGRRETKSERSLEHGDDFWRGFNS